MKTRLAQTLVTIAALFLALSPVAQSESSLVPAPAPTPRQLGMTGKFLVQAQNGVIQYRALRGGHWSRTMVPVTGAELQRKVLDAQASGEPVIDLASFDLISALRRVDSLRLLGGTEWSALSMIVAFHLDDALARGSYRYILVSDDTHHVLVDRSSGDRIHMRTYVRIPGESQESFLKHRHFAGRNGYAFTVPELTRSRAGADYLLERLENVGVARSALLERLIALRV